MEYNNRHMKIDGRVTIPAEIRDKMKIDLNTPLKIYTENGNIIITPQVAVCQFCGSSIRIHTISNITICETCINNINETIKENQE